MVHHAIRTILVHHIHDKCNSDRQDKLYRPKEELHVPKYLIFISLLADWQRSLRFMNTYPYIHQVEQDREQRRDNTYSFGSPRIKILRIHEVARKTVDSSGQACEREDVGEPS
jgi:hypothetical protein